MVNYLLVDLQFDITLVLVKRFMMFIVEFFQQRNMNDIEVKKALGTMPFFYWCL